VLLLLFFLACLICNCGWAADRPPAESWITNGVHFPKDISTNLTGIHGFENLHAEPVAERIFISWKPGELNPNATVTLFASADDPGHWLVRNWRSYHMAPSGSQWHARVPVENIDVPIIYFIQTVTHAATNVSPMRICHPRTLGLEMPSRPFWPFLEGFEQGTESWALLSAATDHGFLSTDSIAKNGYHSLQVSLPPNQPSVTVATTRIRGWQIQQHGATGLRLWLRTKTGMGRARFTLFANAFNTNQVLAVSSIEPKLNEQWQKIDLPLDSFPKLPRGSVDWFTIEFIGNGPADFLIDDIQFIGPWKSQVE
jgi:hypothetical protein